MLGGPAPGGRNGPLSTHAPLLASASRHVDRQATDRPRAAGADECGTNLGGPGSGRLAMVRRMKKLLLLLVLIGLAGLAAKQLSST